MRHCNVGSKCRRGNARSGQETFRLVSCARRPHGPCGRTCPALSIDVIDGGRVLRWLAPDHHCGIASHQSDRCTRHPTFLAAVIVSGAIYGGGTALPDQSRGGSSFPYAAADGALAGGGFLEGDLLADPPALAQLELGFCQRHYWNFARLLPLDEHPRSGAVAAWRPPWYSAHLRGHGAGCSRLAGALGLMAWRAAASL